MPRKPARPCNYPGCANLAHEGAYCEEHARERSRHYERYARDPLHGKRYGGEWRKLRARFLTMRPLCEMCQREGRFTRATEVHHIKPLAEGGTNAPDNLMALCKPCHSRFTLTATHEKADKSC